MTLVKIGLGSNIGDPAKNISTAIAEIAKLGKIIACSGLYLTKPWGITDQPDFCNAAIALETDQKPHELLAALKSIEQSMGRVKTMKWGPRLIDLDILTFGDVALTEPGLTIPHAHMNERAFVLVPLAEIDPHYAAARDSLPAASLAEVTRMMAQ
jgi:2-amino-4-hydroxy-6-hydroxymethyldihydropteridine diphosphokinase